MALLQFRSSSLFEYGEPFLFPQMLQKVRMHNKFEKGGRNG